MTTLLALLRGVNLGSQRTVSMPLLRTTVAELGFTDVRTHLNSGNLILSSDRSAGEVRVLVEAAVLERFGHPVDVAVRTAAELRAVVGANPFPDGDPARVTVAFLVGAPPAGVSDRLAAVAAEGEAYLVLDREIYVYYAHGLGRSRLAARFSAVVQTSATVRNLRTVRRLVELTAP